MRRVALIGFPSPLLWFRGNFGSSYTVTDLSDAEHISPSLVPAMNRYTSAWVALDKVARTRHHLLIQSAHGATRPWTDLLLQQQQPEAGNGNGNVKDAAASTSKKKGKQQQQPSNVKPLELFTSSRLPLTLEGVVTLYDSSMSPIRALQAELEVVQLEYYGLKDVLKLGIAHFKPAVVEEKRKRHAVVVVQKAELQQKIHTLFKESFTTAVINDLVNLLRIVAETDDSARRAGIQILDEVAALDLTFDLHTQMLLKSLTFGDGPQEDSNMLFSFVEYPERGEISASVGSLAAIAEDGLKTIAERHTTTLSTHGRLFLQDKATHPMIQRSAE